MSPESLGFSFPREERHSGHWLRSIFPSSPHVAAFPGASPPASGASPVGMSRDISPGSGAALAPAPSTSVFIHRLAGIRELFLLLYLASAARQALGSCIPVFHRPWNGAGDGLSRTDSSSSAPQPWGRVPLVPPRCPKMFCGSG